MTAPRERIRCGAGMAQRTQNPQQWFEVPASVFDPRERLEVMDAAGIDYAVCCIRRWRGPADTV
jgi:hypothetical protein